MIYALLQLMLLTIATIQLRLLVIHGTRIVSVTRQKLLLLAQESLHVTMASLMLIRCALFVQSIPLMGMEQVSIMIQAVPVRSMLKMTQGPIMSVIYI